MKVIDCHYLYGVDYWMKNNNTNLPYQNYKLQNSNDFVVTHYFITPFPSSINQEYRDENNLLKDAASLDSKLIPVYALNPGNERNKDWIQQVTTVNNICGIVLWPILCNIDLKELKSSKWFVDFLKKFHGWIYIHTGAGNEAIIGRVNKVGKYDAACVLDLAKAFPHNKFILGHLLRLSLPELIEANKLNNVMIDTSFISGHLKWLEKGINVFASSKSYEFSNLDPRSSLERLITLYGMENKLVFGSSFPYCCWWNSNYNDEIDLINSLNVSTLTKEKILYWNIKQFLNL